MQALRPRAAGGAHHATAPLVGRREDELVRREQHPADRSAGGAVRQDDADLRRAASGVVAARRRAAGAGRASRWRRSSSSPGSSSRAPTGSAAARAAEAHFTRVVREGGARGRAGGRASGGDPVHLPAVLAAAFGLSTSEARRMIAQGGVQLDGDAVRRSSTCPATPSPERSSRRGRGASCGSSPRLTAPRLCYTPPAARKGGAREPCNRPRSAFEPIGYDLVPVESEASGVESEAFSLPPTRHRSLKTQQRAFATRPRRCRSSAPVRRRGSRRRQSPVDPVSFGEELTTFEHRARREHTLPGECWTLTAEPFGSAEAICFFTESLILAQDERWRRA